MILVTGASGTVGGHVAQELKARGVSQRTGYHSTEKANKAIASGEDATVIDYADPKTLDRGLAGAEAVFLVATGGVGEFEAETNVLHAARRAGVKRIVKLSVWRAADEQCAFARLHRAIERTIETADVPWTFIRPTSFMQNFATHFGVSIRQTNSIFQPAADAKVSHIDVRDIARVAAEALTDARHECKAYDISGPQP